MLCIRFKTNEGEVFRVDTTLAKMAVESGVATTTTKGVWKAQGRLYLDYELGLRIVRELQKGKDYSQIIQERTKDGQIKEGAEKALERIPKEGSREVE